MHEANQVQVGWPPTTRCNPSIRKTNISTRGAKERDNVLITNYGKFFITVTSQPDSSVLIGLLVPLSNASPSLVLRVIIKPFLLGFWCASTGAVFWIDLAAGSDCTNITFQTTVGSIDIVYGELIQNKELVLFLRLAFRMPPGHRASL